MTKIVEFKIAKRLTVDDEGKTWKKKGLELTVQMLEKHTDEEVQVALARAEYILDTFLGKHEAAKVPQFNPEDLMKHNWKGRKDGAGGYEKGSTAWGWDFKKNFSEELIKTLEKGPIMIDQYEFTVGDQLVSAKKKK